MPFLACPESVRRIIYTTDEIDKSFLLRASVRRLTQNPTHSSQVPAACEQTALHSQTPAQPRPQPPHSLGHYFHSAYPSAASFNPASMRSRSHSPLNSYTAPGDLTEPSRFTYGASASIDPPRTGNGYMPALRNLTLRR